MKKFVFIFLFLFWWCLMFPDTSYISSDVNSKCYDAYSIIVNDKIIRFKFLDFFM